MGKGWHLFRHAAAMILRDLPGTLRVTLPPYVIGAICLTVLIAQWPEATLGGPSDDEMSLPGAGYFLASIGLWFSMLWMAVLWHRWVLLGEVSEAVPPLYPRRLAAYFWKGLLISFILIPAILVVAIPAGIVLFGAGVPQADLIMTFLTSAVALGIFGRFCPVLPAAAVGRSMGLREGWAATAGATGPIVVASVLLAALTTLPPLVFTGVLLIDVVVQIVVQWVLTLLGASLMTTIYGHYVEGLELT